MPLLLRALQFTRKYRWRLAGALTLVFIATGTSLLLPYIWGMIVDQFAAPVGGPTTRAIAASRPDEIWHFIILMCIVLAGTYLVGYLIGYLRSRLLLTVGHRVVFDIRQRLFRHLQRLSLRYFETHRHGWIMARVLYDVEAVQSVLSDQLVNIVSNVVTVVAAVVILYAMNWQLAVVASIALPIYALNFSMLRRRIRHLSREARDQYAQIYSVLDEDISGIRVIKSFGREQWEARRFVKEIREGIHIGINVGVWRAVLGINANLITQLANLVIIIVGCYEIIYLRTLTIGQLVAILGYVGMLYGPIIALVRISDVINWAAAAIERIFETLDTVPDVQERRDPIKLGQIEGHVEMCDVFFAYEPNETVLREVSLEVKPGQVVALVGPSGGGKTTLVHLIPRFYDPVSGQVLIDGHDLRDVSISSLRRNIGMVMQESFLFAGTLRENIKYGRPDASDEEVVQAAIAANAHDFIMEFPDGYETRVGERGARLSGGQRQRITIARAILSDPRILILDEATSDLDSESEALIQDALDKLMGSRTTFIIAHRLSTVINADMILVLAEGRIVEQGTHDQLCTAGGTYERLCNVQFKQAQNRTQKAND